MPRRPRNPSGFVRARQTATGRSWQAIVKYPDPDKPGAWRQRSATFERKAEAQAWVDKALAEHRAQPAYRPPSDMTVAELMEQWLGTLASRNLAPKTIRVYRQMSRHLVDALGQLLIASVTALDLQRLYAGLSEGGKAPRTVRYVHSTANRAFTDAVDWGLMPQNPAHRAKPPKLVKREMEVPTLEEAGALLKMAEGHRLYALWAWLSLTGTRKGEALGLRWADLDLDSGIASIRRSRGGQGIGPTKTEHSVRTISLAPFLVGVLRKHRLLQMEERLLAGDRWRKTAGVFTTSLGTPLSERNVNWDFKTALRRAGLSENYHPHTLRHAMATHWLANGVPAKVVSERLGHASVAFTLQVYGHVLPNQQASAAEAMERDLLSRVTTSSPREHGNA